MKQRAPLSTNGGLKASSTRSAGKSKRRTGGGGGLDRSDLRAIIPDGQSWEFITNILHGLGYKAVDSYRSRTGLAVRVLAQGLVNVHLVQGY